MTVAGVLSTVARQTMNMLVYRFAVAADLGLNTGKRPHGSFDQDTMLSASSKKARTKREQETSVAIQTKYIATRTTFYIYFNPRKYCQFQLQVL